MKTAAIRMLLLTFLTAGAALAQNSDLAILFGAAGPNSGSVGNGVVTGSFGAGVQFNYAAQLHETAAGQLYLELPLMIAARVKGTVANDVTAQIKDSIFLTPGVRWRFTPQKRVSFYAALGVGFGTFGTETDTAGHTISGTSSRTTTVAFGFGGGIDFRLTRLLSLRAEGRDFLTRSGLGGDSGHSHAFFMAGIGFHF